MKKIYLIRHGESDYNAGGAIKPDDEIALTELGHQQADFMAQRMRKLDPEVIISSTFLRAKQTAQHIADVTGKTVVTSDLFKERRYPSGSLGLTSAHPDVQEIEKLMMDRFGEDGYQHSDEELFPEVKDRAAQSLEFLAQRPEDSMAVVSHGIFVRILLAAALFGTEITSHEMAKFVQRFKTKNTGITFLEYNEVSKIWFIRVWNDHAHLG